MSVLMILVIVLSLSTAVKEIIKYKRPPNVVEISKLLFKFEINEYLPSYLYYTIITIIVILNKICIR